MLLESLWWLERALWVVPKVVQKTRRSPSVFCCTTPLNAKAGDKVPASGVIEDYRKALLPKYRPDAINAMEGFRRERYTLRAENHGYEDAPHARYVRISAYRLARLYIQDGKKGKAVEFVVWLEKNDSELK